MRLHSFQNRRHTEPVAPPVAPEQQVLSIDTGNRHFRAIPAWLFAGPRVVDLWPPEARPIWARDKTAPLGAQQVPPLSDAIIDVSAWSAAMQENTRPWVQQFGCTLTQVNYFAQLQERLTQRLAPDARRQLQSMLPTADGALLFNALPQLALRSVGHTPLPPQGNALPALVQDGAAILVWPLLLIAPSCCDTSLTHYVQRALSPAALQRLQDFAASDLGRTFLQTLHDLAQDPATMAADITVRNNLQMGLRAELQGMQRQSWLTRCRQLGEQLHRDVTVLQDMLADKQELFLRATGELDQLLIALREVDALAQELHQGDASPGDIAWEGDLQQRIQQSVPQLHASVNNLLRAVGLESAAGQTLSLLYQPML